MKKKIKFGIHWYCVRPRRKKIRAKIMNAMVRGKKKARKLWSKDLAYHVYNENHFERMVKAEGI